MRPRYPGVEKEEEVGKGGGGSNVMAMKDAHRCFAACSFGRQGIQIRDKCSEGGHIETKTRSGRKGGLKPRPKLV